ncbi:hypothetical protein [Bacillus amyloliquefaciens]|nr:hypothetical protein [Bacillus amyloliquefaciens]UQB84331.1 hypothetical protein KMZ31_19620 [Bacillus amyloliquefaciens]
MTFYIEYKSYMGDIDCMKLTADTEADAILMFNIARPLSDILKIESHH